MDKNDEALHDIIVLTARLTIMVVFIAKAAYLEGIDLYSLYRKLVEKGFKLSDEDVSCEHEKMQNDETIIRQMCILFSLVQFTDADKTVLTYISVIPTLPFSYDKAKNWFGIKKNSILMHLFHVGMLEHSMDQRKHIYWMHSVIAAAVREQQKAVLYVTVSPFMYKISEELECGDNWGKGSVDMYRGIIQKAEQISNYPPTDLCRDYQNFADILEHADSYDEAAIYYVKAITLVKQVFAEDSPNLAQLYLDYATCLMGKEDYQNAINNLKKLEQFIENDSLLERVMEHKLGTCYCLLNDYPEGAKHFVKAARLCEQNKNGSTDIGYIAVDLCIAYSKMGKWIWQTNTNKLH